MNEYERLKKYTEDYQEQLRKERERKKSKPNDNMDMDICDKLSSFDFFCDTCQEDFKSPARKTKYRFRGQLIATVRGKCPYCDNQAVRYATHRDQDPYYQRSPKVRKQRNYYMIDFLRKNEFGFKTLYGDKDKDFNEEMQRREEEIFNKDFEIGLKGRSLETQENLKMLHERRY